MNDKEIKFRVVVADSETDDKDYTLKLAKRLRNELKRFEMDVEMARGEPEAGARGDPINIGTLIITAFTSGAITALINLIGSWIKKRKSKFKLTQGDDSIEIDNLNLESQEVRDFIKELRNQLDK